jgi:glycine/D-amino acid oxidase-like deaminating enzyme
MERTHSLWKATSSRSPDPPLERDVFADVCVIGAGIAGLSVALHLAKAGVRVVVLDRYGVGAGETAQSTAHLASALDDRFENLERIHGDDGARLAYQSHQAAIERVGEIVEAEGIDADYVRLDGYLFLGPDGTREDLEREGTAAWRAGFRDVSLRGRPRLADLGPTPASPGPHAPAALPARHGGRAAAHGRSHPRRHRGHRGLGWTRCLRAHLARPARALRRRGGRHQQPLPRPLRHPHQAGAVPHLRHHGRGAPGRVPDALYWDTADPYHYLRWTDGAGEAAPGGLAA